MINAQRLEFDDISKDWGAFESNLQRLEGSNSKLEILKICRPEDELSIEFADDKDFELAMTFNISLFNEYALIQNARIVILQELGFKLDDDIRFSEESKRISMTCRKIEKTTESIITTLRAVSKRFRSFKAVVELRDTAAYFITDGMLKTMYPYLQMGKPPEDPWVKSIVEALIDAYARDFRQGISEPECGKRVAHKLVDELIKRENLKPAKERISWYPEKLYRILRADKKLKKYERISDELKEFLTMVPYVGPGKRRNGAACGVAYQIKKENQFVLAKLKENGINLHVIFPGG